MCPLPTTKAAMNVGEIYSKGKVNLKGDATFDDLRTQSRVAPSTMWLVPNLGLRAALLPSSRIATRTMALAVRCTIRGCSNFPVKLFPWIRVPLLSSFPLLAGPCFRQTLRSATTTTFTTRRFWFTLGASLSSPIVFLSSKMTSLSAARCTIWKRRRACNGSAYRIVTGPVPCPLRNRLLNYRRA